MKRLIVTTLMLTAAVSFSFADEGEQSRPQAPQAQETSTKTVKEATLRTGDSNFVTGKVDSVTGADLLTKPRSRIVIVDGSGKSDEFAVKALAVIYDSTGRFLTLDNVRPGQEVLINYIARSGRTKEVVSIKILK
jgi:accessory colonization factor AcfC